MRARLPVLPALAAALAGALVAGVVTLLSGAPGASAADQGRLALDADGSHLSNADLEHRRTTKTPTTPAAPATTTQPATITPKPTTTTAPPTTEAPPPVTTKPDTSVTDQVVTLTNAQRQQQGCTPLAVNASITAAAQGHADDMANRDYFEHTTPDGVTFDQRIRNAGYSSPGAENIAKGASTAEQVVQMWMDSPGHRRNILNCDLNTIGVGFNSDGLYWVQDFGF